MGKTKENIANFKYKLSIVYITKNHANLIEIFDFIRKTPEKQHIKLTLPLQNTRSEGIFRG